MAEADLILLVIDGVVGVVDEDLAVARLLQRAGQPVRVVANKVDSAAREPDAWTAVSLGLGDPWPVSALHGRGIGDLLDEVVSLLPVEDSGAPSEAAEGDVGEGGGGERGRPLEGGRHSPSGHRRAAQCGQVHALQPPGG